ncbi:MAG: hypothetical protein EBZ76_10675 [Synechococcaceae bacterium WB9_2_170]|nr:hypothetical protein [Synechococcaceae bacterium WB9_2_170]
MIEREQLRELLGTALDAGLEALADGLAAAMPAGGAVRMVDPAALVVDPRRFQFRMSTINLSGTDGRLRDACRWNPALAGVLLVWAEPGGQLCLIDGHHRHRLAMANSVPLVAVLLVEAADAKAARVQGALSNVANGTAEAPDLAKLMRDCGMSAADVARHGVSSPGPWPVRQGLHRGDGAGARHGPGCCWPSSCAARLAPRGRPPPLERGASAGSRQAGQPGHGEHHHGRWMPAWPG